MLWLDQDLVTHIVRRTLPVKVCLVVTVYVKSGAALARLGLQMRSSRDPNYIFYRHHLGSLTGARLAQQTPLNPPSPLLLLTFLVLALTPQFLAAARPEVVDYETWVLVREVIVPNLEFVPGLLDDRVDLFS
jgi:hypothetical protein